MKLSKASFFVFVLPLLMIGESAFSLECRLLSSGQTFIQPIQGASFSNVDGGIISTSIPSGNKPTGHHASIKVARDEESEGSYHVTWALAAEAQFSRNPKKVSLSDGTSASVPATELFKRVVLPADQKVTLGAYIEQSVSGLRPPFEIAMNTVRNNIPGEFVPYLVLKCAAASSRR